MLVDSEIKSRIQQDKLLENCETSNIFNIGYDLVCESFSNQPGSRSLSYSLLPGECVFVKSKETLNMPTDLCARINLRNSRIRQGLSLDAPVYQPGHETRVFFRLRNVSSKEILLNSGDKVASIFFEKLDTIPDSPYSGTFQNEFDYQGMGDYATQYNQQIVEVEKKITDLKEIERSLYGNVITLMTIFIGIFSLVNLNITGLTAASWTARELLRYNLCVVGGISTLAGLIRVLVPDLGRNAMGNRYWTIPVLSFVAALVIGVLPA